MSEKGVGVTINAWAKTLRASRAQLAAQLDEDKLVGLKGLEELGLPSR
ncbi:MAG: hypothetical protein JO123_06960 [Ktedonobacteraceae bacterium]|nr:hypothetical protein [Ktedonobacteraceae bacterium]